MSKIWDEREKGLEEEYFHRKEQELLEKLHARRAERNRAEASVISCPRCEGALAGHLVEGVHIDRCNKCGGVWLDPGELELLFLKHEQTRSWLSRIWKTIAGG
jgi:uncharacterized protein